MLDRVRRPCRVAGGAALHELIALGGEPGYDAAEPHFLLTETVQRPAQHVRRRLQAPGFSAGRLQGRIRLSQIRLDPFGLAASLPGLLLQILKRLLKFALLGEIGGQPVLLRRQALHLTGQPVASRSLLVSRVPRLLCLLARGFEIGTGLRQRVAGIVEVVADLSQFALRHKEPLHLGFGHFDLAVERRQLLPRLIARLLLGGRLALCRRQPGARFLLLLSRRCDRRLERGEVASRAAEFVVSRLQLAARLVHVLLCSLPCGFRIDFGTHRHGRVVACLPRLGLGNLDVCPSGIEIALRLLLVPARRVASPRQPIEIGLDLGPPHLGSAGLGSRRVAGTVQLADLLVERSLGRPRAIDVVLRRPQIGLHLLKVAAGALGGGIGVCLDGFGLDPSLARHLQVDDRLIALLYQSLEVANPLLQLRQLVLAAVPLPAEFADLLRERVTLANEVCEPTAIRLDLGAIGGDPALLRADDLLVIV